MNRCDVVKAWLLCLLFLCVSCGARSQEDFQQEGQRIAKELANELQRIRTRDELVAAAPSLTRRFDELVDVMIAARQYQQQHAWEEVPELSSDGVQLNVRLQIELQRVFNLDGGRELIEKYQEASLNRLDAFEKQLAKKRAAIP